MRASVPRSVRGLDETVARAEHGSDQLAQARVVVADENRAAGSRFGLSLCSLHREEGAVEPGRNPNGVTGGTPTGREPKPPHLEV